MKKETNTSSLTEKAMQTVSHVSADRMIKTKMLTLFQLFIVYCIYCMQPLHHRIF